MKSFFSKYGMLVGVSSGVTAAAVAVWWGGASVVPVEYVAPGLDERNPAALQNADLPEKAANTRPVPPPPVHVPTPSPVRAVYMTSWVAGTPSIRDQLVRFVRSSKVNAIVIDVKDYTGKVAFVTGDPRIVEMGSEEARVPDMRRLIEDLHADNIYTIARISVFQDPHVAMRHPDIAVQTADGSVWKDHKGLSWVDPASREMWEYTVRVARAAEAAGFDELNFDYIRFPSDGNLKNISYPVWDGITEESDVIAEFFAYLDTELSDVPIPISLDLFGMTMTNYDDLNIGQVLEKAAPHADYIAPMVYPSHYPPTWNGLSNPAANPYEVVFYAMSQGEQRLDIMRALTASTTSPLFGKTIAELRPWLQDFDLGADYTADMVRLQMQAVYDAGLDSWMVWDPKNIYTKEAYR